MGQDKKQPQRDQAPSASPPAHERPQRTTSSALLGGQRELIIEHHGRDYRLRLTQQGKLILTA